MRTFMLGLALAAGLGTALTARAALAEDRDIGAQPWFPIIDEAKGPQETFELNTLSVIHIEDEGWRASRGKYRASLSRHDFFVTIGRTDLAAKDRRAAVRSSTLVWVGAGVAITGGLLTWAYLSPGGYQPPGWLGLGLLGAGALSIYIGGKIDGPDVTPEEADEFARRYNERLKAHIEEEIGAPRRVPTQVQLLKPRLVPWTDGRAGGLIALAAF
jgi:hypothetical protein